MVDVFPGGFGMAAKSGEAEACNGVGRESVIIRCPKADSIEPPADQPELLRAACGVLTAAASACRLLPDTNELPAHRGDRHAEPDQPAHRGQSKRVRNGATQLGMPLGRVMLTSGIPKLACPTAPACSVVATDRPVGLVDRHRHSTALRPRFDIEVQ